MRRWVVLGLLAGCDAEVDLVVDATLLTLPPDGTTLYIDLVSYGETESRVIIDVAKDTVSTHPDQIKIGRVYGVAAFLDGNNDGLCNADTDTTWVFEYAGVYNEPFVWEINDNDFTDAAACQWFGTLDFNGE